MRLLCDVVLVKETAHNSLYSRTHPTRCSRGVITLKRNEIKSGSRYVLHVITKSSFQCPSIEVTQSNVEHIHQTHVASGRLTLVFAQPRVSLMIVKCIPSQLKQFLDKILTILNGGEIIVENLEKVKSSLFVTAPKKLRLTSDSLKDVKYPSSLETLEAIALGLYDIDSRWFSLPMLSHLDLSCNFLGMASNFLKIKLISRLTNLRFLSLERNEIETIPPYFFDSLPLSLHWLNLAQNRLVRLPQSLVKAKSLHTLVLSHNQLSSLPMNIADMHLRCLFLDHNRLSCLPYDLKNRRLEKLYFNNNPMAPPVFHVTEPTFPSLSAVAFASIRNYSLQENILPWDVKMIADSLCIKCTYCEKWKASSLVSLLLVEAEVTKFAYETDMLQPITLQAFSCSLCLYRVRRRS
ncbi:leucine Rich repeat-containing domain protein [Dictyocaulus viviparus]|uniref:Leucine Rich repeat-containing domain protein n=1 Tax=Dictyocaulus viviparus TaxID=29172 RepID=A0A0D8XDJ8_DICVI|nr:leucine Rich repeat-containing domain protein [Dictyocaulus viviparus]